jgi:hypothetical protein
MQEVMQRERDVSESENTQAPETKDSVAHAPTAIAPHLDGQLVLNPKP